MTGTSPQPSAPNPNVPVSSDVGIGPTSYGGTDDFAGRFYFGERQAGGPVGPPRGYVMLQPVDYIPQFIR